MLSSCEFDWTTNIGFSWATSVGRWVFSVELLNNPLMLYADFNTYIVSPFL